MSTLGKKLDFIVQKIVLPGLIVGLLGALVLGYILFYPNKFTDTGYKPTQPIQYSHKLHAGDLGISCSYCHGNAEKHAVAGVPPTQVCMNCHSVIKRDSPEVQKVVKSFENNEPIEWIRVHKLPDFVNFKHNVHIQSGISCFDCHGPIDKMEVVYQAKPLSMGFCLNCHRNETALVKSTRMEDALERATKDESFFEKLKGGFKKYHGIEWIDEHQRKKGSTNCSACHY